VSESRNPGRASGACRGTRLRAPILVTQPYYATLGVRLREFALEEQRLARHRGHHGGLERL